jgi:hypothetical protein
MNEIEQALKRIFNKHRIVLWYDDKRELRQEFEAVALRDVEKITVDNNEFGVKVRILREQPEQKFLLYHEGPPPEDELDDGGAMNYPKFGKALEWVRGLS